MTTKKFQRVIVCALSCLVLSIGAAQSAMSQDGATQQQQQQASQPRRINEASLDTELYLLVASNQASADSHLPASLDPVIKQLRATLPFTNYSLGATLLNRVKGGGKLNLSWVGGTLFRPAGSIGTFTPSLGNFSISRVNIAEEDGNQVVQLIGFSFGTRIPIQTGTTLAQSGTNSAPVIAYENTGIVTDITVRPDQPTVVGTLSAGSSGEAVIVVINARRVH